MELHQVRYALAAAHWGNFTRAAESCGVSQPALTNAIRKLEGELNGELFLRERGGVRLSKLGEIVLPVLRRMQTECASVERLAKRFQLLEQPPLQVAVGTTLGPRKLARFVADFRRVSPGIELELESLPQDALLTALDQGRVEIAIGSETTGPPWLVARALYCERYVVVLPPGHALTAAPTICLRDLDEEVYVDRLACEMREQVMAVCSERSTRLYPAYRTGQESLIECLVEAGVGLALMPEFSVISPTLEVRSLVDPALTRRVNAMRHADRTLSPAAQQLWKVLTENGP